MSEKREILEASVSETVLEETPERAVTFIRAIGTSKAIRRAMMSRGYTSRDHREGWELLTGSSGFVGGEDDLDHEDAEVADAMRELDAADESLIRIVRASLRRRFPAQAEVVLKNLAPATGAAAVVVVATLLARLDALESSRDADDQAALALLATRGIHAEERTRLRKLVKQAQSAKPVEDVSEEETRAERDQRNALVRLRAWYEEWSDIARATIRRRDHLIRLGLATRRSPAKPAEPGDEPAA